jgi:hypothetical protein
MQNAELLARLAHFGACHMAENSVLASGPDELVRGWKTALDRAGRRVLDPATMTWVKGQLRRLTTEEATEETRALAAEIDAALRLSWIDAVTRVGARDSPTCDFRVGALNVEVYCPQEHREERRVVQAELAEHLRTASGPVKVAIAIGYPTTGSGRKVNEEGRVVRDVDSQAMTFPVNKLIDRALNAKWNARQFAESEPNVLWLDLKHGMGLLAKTCLPLRSTVTRGTCFVGMNGVWQAFYGRKGDPLFAERTTLEYPLRPGTYAQYRDGWFREVRKVSCAIVSVLDGLVRMDNPWAAVPLDPATSELLMTLSEIRPEFSWFDDKSQTLTMRVEAERRRIAWIAQGGGSRR